MRIEDQCRALAQRKGFEANQRVVNGKHWRTVYDSETGEVFAEGAEWADILPFLEQIPAMSERQRPRPSVQDLVHSIARDKGYKVLFLAHSALGQVSIAEPTGSNRVVARAPTWCHALRLVLGLAPLGDEAGGKPDLAPSLGQHVPRPAGREGTCESCLGIPLEGCEHCNPAGTMTPRSLEDGA